MKHNIFELAKKLAALSPRDGSIARRLIREHGYLPGERTSVIIDLAGALTSVWDGKASTLDQASAWREVWKYLGDAGLVKESSGRSRLGQVLDILGDYRRMSAGAAPLYLVQQVSINGEFSDADLEDVKAAMRQNNSGSRISPTGRSASLPKTPEPWPTPSADKVNEIEKLAIHFSGCRSNAKCIPHEGTREEFECLAQYCMDLALQVKDIYTGRMDTLDFRGLEERVTAWVASQEQPYDPANAKPCHPSHELYKTSDADAPEQIKDRNGEVVLDQCRYCRRAESQLLDGEPCAVEPVDDSEWEGREFSKGCTVYLKSGGPAMTVADVQHINGDAVMYLCSWGEGSKEQEDWFRPTSLTRQAPEREPGRFHPGDYVRHAENGERGVVVECTTKGLLECRVRWDSYQDEPEWVENRKLNLAAANDNAPLENTRASENLGDVSYETSLALEKLATVVEPARLDVVRRLLVLQDTCYGLANNAGWWTDLETGEDVRNWPKKHLDNWVSAKLMLIVTEVAEAMEGHRKGLKDDKLPHRGMLEVELADAVIRIMDLAGGLNMDVAGAIVEKLAYNLSREDHRIENRKAAGGKSV